MNKTEIKIKGNYVYFLGYAIECDSEDHAQEFAIKLIERGVM